MSVTYAVPLFPFTPLLGRKGELEAIVQCLTTERARLLTLTGPAGVGKTRLALEAADRLAGYFPDGVVTVDLAPVRDPDLVPSTLARALGFHDSGPRPLHDLLGAYLADRNLLLLLDNFEQVLPAAACLAQLLASSPGLRILVTSRIPLRLRSEQTLRISPLPVPELDAPPPLERLVQMSSVALFIERAQAVRRDFKPTERDAPLLGQLIRHLDGLPLAIELASVQVQVLPLGAVTRRLEQRVQSLRWNAQDLPDRQRSLHAAISWSYELLTEDEQRLFRHLGVFVGRVSLDAIAAVVGDTEGEQTLAGMSALVEKSLVLPARVEDEDPEPSFGMLETIREFAREQLEHEGELEAALDAHARYHLDLAERATPELAGPYQRMWYLRLGQEHDNLRAALRRLIDTRDHARALHLVSMLSWFWWTRGYHTEGWRWFEEALTPEVERGLRIRAVPAAGFLLMYHGARERARELLREALADAEARQDREAIATALTYLGAHALFAGNQDESARLLEDALKRWRELEEGHAFHIGIALSYLAFTRYAQGDHKRAATLLTEAIACHESEGDLRTTGGIRFLLALISEELGDRTQALKEVRAGLQVSIAFEDRSLLRLGVDATLLLIDRQVHPEQRARLLGADAALSQGLGASSGFLEQVMAQGIEAMRDELLAAGAGPAYRHGTALSFHEIADLALTILDEFGKTVAVSRTPGDAHATEGLLSERERGVLQLVAQGLTSRQIGQRLFLSHRTVDHHLTSIFNKLGVDNRAQAVAVATRDALM